MNRDMQSFKLILDYINKHGANEGEMCGQGYPSQGLPCRRPKWHTSPTSDCFAIDIKRKKGCFMYQDGKEWTSDVENWPKDLIL